MTNHQPPERVGAHTRDADIAGRGGGDGGGSRSGAVGKRTRVEGLVQRKGRAASTMDPAPSYEESRATIDIDGKGDATRPAVAEGGAEQEEPGWVRRARAYHEAHPAEAEALDRLTWGACVGEDGALDPRKVARWQAAHGVPPDGRAGEVTLDAARSSGGGARGGGDRAATREPTTIDAPARYDEVDRGTIELGADRASPEGSAGRAEREPLDRRAEQAAVSIDAAPRYDEDRGTIDLARKLTPDADDATAKRAAIDRRAEQAAVTIDAPPSYDEGRATLDVGGPMRDAPRVASAVQRKAGARADAASESDVHAIAASGVAGAAAPLPHLAAIQASFGRHDVSHVRAAVGGAAATASDALGAEAYATGATVAFRDTPSLHTAAHEAAHVIQQQAGVSLKGGVGEAGDAYEQHADAVADAVVRGESAEALLGEAGGTHRGSGTEGVQFRKERFGDAAKEHTVGLLLRDLLSRMRKAAGKSSASRLAVAATEIAHGCAEVQRVMELGTVEQWTAVGAELRAVLAAGRELLRALEDDRLAPVKAELFEALRALGRQAQPEALNADEGEDPGEMKGLDADERIRMYRLMLAAARERIRALPGVGKGEAASSRLVALAGEVAGDVGYVAEGLAAMKDTAAKRALKKDALATVESIDEIEGWIDAGEIPWHRELARLFDAEAKLVAQSHVPRRHRPDRPYSGTMDPKEALAAVEGAPSADGADLGAICSRPFADPKSALQGIAAGLDHTFAVRSNAVDAVENALAEPAPPADPGVLESLLKLAVEMAIVGAAGALASAVSARARSALDQRAASSTVANESMEELLAGPERAKALGSFEIPTDGAVRRAAAADAIKDVTKQLFRDSARAGVEALTLGSSAGLGREPKTHYFRLQREALSHARTAARLLLAHHGNALVQADLTDLNELSRMLCDNDARERAQTLQVDATHREWQNFKASWHAGTVAEKSRDAKHALTEIPGVLEVRVDVDLYQPSSGQARVYRLVLRDAEQAAIDQFRKQRATIATSGLNVRYYLEFGGWTVVLSAGPQLGLRLGELGRDDLQILKAYGSGEAIDGWVTSRVDRDPTAYDDVPVSVAHTAARSIVEPLAEATTLESVESK